MSINTHEPPPKASTGDTWKLVIADMEERRYDGIVKYGTPLQPGNGRRNLVDAYQECLDLAVYLRNEIESRNVPVIRRDEDGALDEALGAAHLERMGDDDEWCLIFGEGPSAVIFDIAGKVMER